MNAHLRFLWPHLPALVSVARMGSYRAAADELKIDRSTVSRHISAAEQLLNMRLFDRGANGPRLTKAGRQIVAGLEGAEEMVKAAVAAEEDEHQALAGTVKVTIAPNLAGVIAEGIFDLLRAEPHINLHISATYMVQDIAGNEADIAMRVIRDDPDPSLVATCVGDIRGAIYRRAGPKGSSAAEPVFVHRAGDIQKPPYVAGTQDQSEPRLIVEGIAAHAAFVGAGGQGRMPHFMARQDTRLEAVSQTLPFEGWRLWVVSTEPRLALKRVRRTYDWLVDLAAGLVS